MLARICRTFAFVPVWPAKAFCSLPTSACPRGAETKKPYNAILNGFESILAAARKRSYAGASFDTFLVGTPAMWFARIS